MTIKTEEEEEEKEEEVKVAAAAANSKTEFSNAFYCPLTKKIMVDPVVDISGESFERSAVTARDQVANVTGVVTYYPNRALQAIIERELERHAEKGSMRGRVLALEESLRSGFGRLVEKSVLPGDYRPLPDSFYCPITLELMRKPVIDPDGKTFERDAISNWIRVNGTSPVTRKVLAVHQLRSNEALHDLIDEEKERTDASIHPSIRRWKMEDPTVETGSPTCPVDPPGGAPPAAPFVGSNNDGSVRVYGSNTNGQSVLDPPRGAPPPADTRNDHSYVYPTTQAEIDARWRRSVKCSALGILFLVFVMLAAVIFFPMYAILIGIILFCCCVKTCQTLREEE
jgi:hypothetical protein